MNNLNPKLRSALGISALTALSLAMVACGGSSSSAPAAVANVAPSTPTISGPTSAITGHPATYNLSATDAEGDQIDFVVSGLTPAVPNVGPTNGSGSFNWIPASQGTQTMSVIAQDHGTTRNSNAATFAVNVAANRPPQFISQPNGQFTGSTSAVAWTPSFVVSAQDPDTDDVVFSVGAASFKDNNGNNLPTSTGAISIGPSTGAVSFTGNVPPGATSITASFTVTAADRLPGGGALLGGTATQNVSLTYFNGNLPPSILTSSLPSLPLNHWIPIYNGGSGFTLTATDPNGVADTNSLTWTMAPVTGLQLSNSPTALTTGPVTGPTAYLLTNGSWAPHTVSGSTPVTVTVQDLGGLSNTRTLTISDVADAVPTLNSNVYTETVSGVVAFDPNNVRGLITSRAQFYPGVIDWLPTYWALTNYVNVVFPEVPQSAYTDAQAIDNVFSNYSGVYPGGFLGALANSNLPAKGWNARTIFKDNEGDGISYKILPNSVFVAGSGPYVPVGQPFVPGAAYPVILFGSPDDSEFPMVDATLGTIKWRPVLATEAVVGPIGFPFGGNDAFQKIFAMPTVWSFTVEATENVWNPVTSGYVPVAANKGQQNYTVKVQPNNPPVIGPLTTIPNATLTVPGALANLVVNPLTTVSIGGGASTSATAYGRPSIQEPESRRYDISAGTGFDYAAANTVKPAVWRWLMAMPGGDILVPPDVQMYDPDMTTQSGHQDAINGAMGTPTIPAADTTGNIPALAAGSVSFYNPWLTAGDAGSFQVNWGPNRTQYLIARVTASAAYSFPVEVRDQYERIGVQKLNINPIFGTVRFTNSRQRVVADAAVEIGAFKRGGTLLPSANPGDPTIGSTHYTFSYLPFPADSGSGTEYDFGTFLFSGSGPASGHVSFGPTQLYSAASWITLNATEAPSTLFHTGNPLNDEAGSFNLPAYASALDGSSASSARADWKTYKYDYVNGSNPTNPAVENRGATGSYANHEVRAQVIPSNSPYLMAFNVDIASGGYFGQQALERQGSSTQIPLKNGHNSIIPGNVGPSGEWYDHAVSAHGWVYNLYQGEVDMQNAVAGRGVSLSTPFGATMLRWTYSWPTQITQLNLGIAAVGGANKWEKGDLMQIAVPNQGANARYFFVGDGSNNDSNKANIYGWGCYGISTTLPAAVNDSDLVFGTATANGAFNGLLKATNTPVYVPSNSLWIYNNFNGAGTTGFLNTPNRTSFSPGATSTQIPYGVGVRGYVDNSIAGAFNNVDPGYITTYPTGNALPGLIDPGQGDNTYFLWLKHDTATSVGGSYPTAWGTWDASTLVPGSTYTVTGGVTTTPGFSHGGTSTSGMTDLVANSTLPASLLSDAQISMASGNLPGQNHVWNVDVKTDSSMYNPNILSAQGWARNEWGLAAPTMGYQPAGTNNVRLVNPDFDSAVVAANTAHAWNNARGDFHKTVGTVVSVDGGVRDSAIIYGVRKHTDENGTANAELGLAGIEPGSPMLAQWYNETAITGDQALNASTVALTSMGDVAPASKWPKVFQFYSPVAGSTPSTYSATAAWANVAEFKVNYLVGVTYPDANAVDPTNVSTNTLWKVPAAMANVFPLGAPVTDPTCTNVGGTINPGNPIVRPIQFLRITDFTGDTTPGTIHTVIDLVASSPTSAASGAGALNLLGHTYIRAMSNTKLSFQASINNQVLPSGYVVDLFQLTGTATTTNQPVLLSTFRAGHIGLRDAIQNIYLPSMHSFTGLFGNGAPANAVYFFRIRTVWNKGINFEKTPTKQSIPMAYADYISAPFVTQ